MSRRAAISLAALALLLLAAIAWRLNAGGALWTVDADQLAARLDIRLLRIGAALGVGACLAVAGVVLQALLRNPLASPDIMGMSSAASLAVMISLYITSAAAPEGWSLATGSAWHAAPALLGALLALALVYALGQRRGLIDPTALVLIGVVVSVVCGAGVLFVQHLMPGMAMSAGAMRLLVGSISDNTPASHVLGVGILALVGACVAIALGPAMDAASLGDDEASSMGVRIRTLRVALLALSGVLTAGAVVLAGPIGFVGLVSPHLVRLMAGPGLGAGRWGGYRLLTLGSALAGAALVIAADAAVKSLDFGAGRMPLGIITAVVGGVSFILLLRAETRS